MKNIEEMPEVPRGHMIEMQISCESAICLIGQIQLALRHPQNVGASRNVVESIARKLQKAVTMIAPDWNDIFEMGWDESNQVKPEEN